MHLRNRVAIITGASEGIGEAIARCFVGEGACVALAARSQEKLQALAAALGRERTLVVPTDVADATQAKQMVARTVEHFGGLDILVNNAGIGLYALLRQMDWEHFQRMWEVNFFGAVRCTLAALPHLEERQGVVVNISSVAGKITLPYMAGYCASKSALAVFSAGLRMELAKAGVRVLVVYPGRVRTRFHASAYRDGHNLPGVFKRREVGGIAAEEVARVTLRAVRRARREVVVPWVLRLAVGFRTLFPSFTDGMLQRMVRQHGRDGQQAREG